MLLQPTRVDASQAEGTDVLMKRWQVFRGWAGAVGSVICPISQCGGRLCFHPERSVVLPCL